VAGRVRGAWVAHAPVVCLATPLPTLYAITNSRNLKLVHTATPDTTRLSCLCRVRFGGVNWIPDSSRLSPTENLKSEHVIIAIVQFRPPSQTRHRLNCLVVSGGRCELCITEPTVFVFVLYKMCTTGSRQQTGQRMYSV